MELVIHLIVAAFFILLGILFRRGKGLSLVAGYNTMSKAQKEKIDSEKLSRYMSNLMFALAVCWLIIACQAVFHQIAFLWIGMAAVFLVIIIGVIFMNTGNRIMKK